MKVRSKAWSRAHNTFVASALVLALALAGLAGAAFAQEGDETTQPAATKGIVPESPAEPQPGGAGAIGWGGRLAARVAGILKMTVDDIAAARRAGRSFVDIAKEKGVSEADLLEALVAQVKAGLDGLVSSGRISRDRADRMLANVRADLEAALKRTDVGPNRAGAAMGRRLGMAGRRAPGGALGRDALTRLEKSYSRGWVQGFRHGLGMGLRMKSGSQVRPFCQQSLDQQD